VFTVSTMSTSNASDNEMTLPRTTLNASTDIQNKPTNNILLDSMIDNSYKYPFGFDTSVLLCQPTQLFNDRPHPSVIMPLSDTISISKFHGYSHEDGENFFG